MLRQLNYLPPAACAAKYLWYLHEDDGGGYAADKASHNRCGYVGNYSARPEQCHKQERDSHEKTDDRHKLYCLSRAALYAKCGKKSSHKGGRCRVYAEDKLLRGGEKSEYEYGENGTVQAVNSRKSRYLGISHGYGYGYKCYDDAR